VRGIFLFVTSDSRDAAWYNAYRGIWKNLCGENLGKIDTKKAALKTAENKTRNHARKKLFFAPFFTPKSEGSNNSALRGQLERYTHDMTDANKTYQDHE
jgi:hypothetical protein